MDGIKQEASMPVQSRIDIRTLVDMAEYWKANGVYIKSMSQLLSWSVELAHHLLEINNALPTIVNRVSDANSYLIERGLYQPGTRGRAHKKILNAMSFESMRAEGMRPKDYVEHQYNVVHNPHSVDTPTFHRPVLSDELIEKHVKLADEKRERELESSGKLKEKDPMVIYKTVDQEVSLPQRPAEEKDPMVVCKTIDQSIDVIEKKASTETVPVKTKTKPKTQKKSDMPRRKTKEELDQIAIDLERKDKEYADKLRNM